MIKEKLSIVYLAIFLEKDFFDLFSGGGVIFIENRAYNRPRSWPRDTSSSPKTENNLKMALFG